MTPEEKFAFEIRIAHAEEEVKSAISLVEVEGQKSLVYDSLKAIELLLEIANMSLANMSLDDS